MTKSELIEQVSELLKLPNGKAEQIVNCIFDSMVKALQEDDGIEIRGFGSFTVREYKSYDGRNPRTGETVHVAPKRLPFFKVGKDLRERVNRGAGKAMPIGKPMTAPEYGQSEQGRPDHEAIGRGAPEQGMPEQGMPEQGMPEQGMPEQGMIDQGTIASGRFAPLGEDVPIMGNGEGVRVDMAPEAPGASETGAPPRSAPSDALSSSSISVRGFGSSSEPGWE